MPVMDIAKTTLTVDEEDLLKISEKIQQNKNESEKFVNDLEKMINGKMSANDVITLGETPNVLRVASEALSGISQEARMLTVNQSVLNNSMNPENVIKHGHTTGHNLPLETIKQLPEHLRNPIMICKGSKENSVAVITELTNKDGKNILASINIDVRGKTGQVDKITSIYGKDDMKAYLEHNTILAYNKEKADELFTDIGANSPQATSIICFDNSIPYSTQNVKYPEQENSEITHFHNPVEHNKLLPILNAKADFHESRLETLKDKRDTRTAKIERNEVKITKLSLKADKLEDLNKMFSSMSERSSIFKTIVARNEQKINAIRNEKIPARQQKIKNHQNRIAEIDRKSEIIGHKLERCVALSDTVKSFAVIGAERRQRFANAMDKLNQSTLACLNDKKAALIDKLESQTQKYNAPETAISAKSDIQSSINKCNTQISDLDNKISTLSQNHATYAKKSEAEIDTVMQNTANAVQTSLETGEISVAAIAEKACLSAAQENPFEYLKNAEMAMEDDYNSIDGIINNGKRDEPPQENNISQSEADKGTNTVEDTKEKRYINPDYYKSLKAAERAILAVSAVEAQRLMNKLNENKIPFSAVKSGTNLKITVSNSNKDKTYELLNADKAKFLNPEFYKNLDKKERFTQRMDEKSARAVVGELRKNDIEHSAVLNGDKSAVTIKQSDYPKVTSFQISRNFLKKRTEEKHKASPKEPDKVKNKDRGERS